MADLLNLTQSPYLFIIPAIYSVILMMRLPSRIKLLAAGVAAVLGLCLQAILVSYGSAALSMVVGISVVMLLALLNITGRSTTLLLAISLLALPPGAWIFPFGGLMSAGLVSAIIVWRTRGTDYLRMSTAETLASVGLVGGSLQKPDLSRLPVEEPNLPNDASSESRTSAARSSSPRTQAPRVSVPAFILGSLVIGGLVGFLSLG